MTIRLRCAECRRKLKVPDAARGRRVQCPVCGALFREGTSPPVETPLAPAQVEPLAAVEPEVVEVPASSEADLIEAAFAEMMASAPDTPEQADSSPIPNLELEAPAAETEDAGFEALGTEEGTEEPVVVDEAVEEEIAEITEETEEPVVVDEAVEEEIAEITEEAVTEDAVEVVDDAEGEEALASLGNQEEGELVGLDELDGLNELDEGAEVVEEAEPEDEEEKRPKKKKKGGFLSFFQRKSRK